MSDGKKPLCPNFIPYSGDNGTCKIIRITRGEGDLPGGCEYGGDLDECLKCSSQDFKNEVTDSLVNYIEAREEEVLYFKTLLIL